jgi:hypothetical protein
VGLAIHTGMGLEEILALLWRDSDIRSNGLVDALQHAYRSATTIEVRKIESLDTLWTPQPGVHSGHSRQLMDIASVPRGIRTPVAAVKGRCPRPG